MRHLFPFYPYLSGLLTFIPGLHKFAPVGGTSSATYSLHLFLRHLSNLYLNSGISSPPRTILELGPGNSLGFGLAAMLAYECDYMALDVDSFFNASLNITILDELYNIYTSDQFSVDQISRDFLPKSEHTLSPLHIETWANDNSSIKNRYQLIRRRLQSPILSLEKRKFNSTNLVNYSTQYSLSSKEAPSYGPIDCIFSQATLEHVDDLTSCLHYLRTISTPNTFQSHEIDLSSHNIAKEWNGHWKYSDRQWFFIRGYRPHYINRKPLSYYLCLLDSLGYRTIHQEVYFDPEIPSIGADEVCITTEPSDFKAQSCYFLVRPKNDFKGGS